VGFRLLPPLKPFPAEGGDTSGQPLMPSDFDGLFVMARAFQSSPSVIFDLRLVDISQASLILTVGLLALILGASKAPLASFIFLHAAHQFIAWTGAKLLFESPAIRQRVRTRLLLYSSLIILWPKNSTALLSYPALVAFPSFLLGLIALTVAASANSLETPGVRSSSPNSVILLTFLVLTISDNYLSSFYLFAITCFSVKKILAHARNRTRLLYCLALLTISASLHLLSSALAGSYGSQVRISYSKFVRELSSNSSIWTAIVILALSFYEAKRSRASLGSALPLLIFGGIFAPSFLAILGIGVSNPFSALFYLSSLGVEYPMRLAGFALGIPLMVFVSAQINPGQAVSQKTISYSGVVAVVLFFTCTIFVSNLRVVEHWENAIERHPPDGALLVFDDARSSTQSTILASFGIRAQSLSPSWWSEILRDVKCFSAPAGNKDVLLWSDNREILNTGGAPIKKEFVIANGRGVRYLENPSANERCDRSLAPDETIMALLEMSSPVLTEGEARRTLHIPTITSEECAAHKSCQLSQLVRVESSHCDDWHFWIEPSAVQVRGNELLFRPANEPLMWLQIRSEAASITCLEHLRLTTLATFP
jgi:hypothetical protein